MCPKTSSCIDRRRPRTRLRADARRRRGTATLETLLITVPLMMLIYLTLDVYDFWSAPIDSDMGMERTLFEHTATDPRWIASYPTADGMRVWTKDASRDSLPLNWVVVRDVQNTEAPLATLRGSCTWMSFPWLRSQHSGQNEGQKVQSWYKGQDACKKLGESRKHLKLGS